MFKSLLKKAATKAKERLDEHVQQQNHRYQNQSLLQQQPQQIAPDQNAAPMSGYQIVHSTFPDFQVPRRVSPQNPWGLCEPCSTFGSWLNRCLQTGNWSPYVNPSTKKPHQFQLGFLDQLLVTKNCCLCRLLETALFKKFPEMHLTYHRPSGGLAREEITLDVSSLLKSTHDLGIELGVILASHEEQRDLRLGSSATTMFGTGLRVVDEDAHLLPASSLPSNGVGKIVPPGQCNLENLLQVYRHCVHQHGNICETPRHQEIDLSGGAPKPMPSITGLRVIDVRDMCIVEAPLSCRFIALSYVWGKTKFLLLKKENRHLLEQPQALEREVIPRTVRESILLTRMMGERYLWVDALCIVQDDDSLKIPQITQMDKIYLSAALTIVSASGEHANSGLAGLMPSSRENTQDVQNIAGIRFVSISGPLFESLPRMKWYTRAWTFQEFILSKRIMMFTDYQVFYHCNLRNFCEDAENKPVLTISPQPPPTIDGHTHWNVDQRHLIGGQRQVLNTQVFHPFMRLVENITSRDLTNDADILRSVTGILEATSLSCHEKFICGMPTSILECALLWEPVDQVHERGNTYDGGKFPSWSWTGWKGPIKYHHLFFPSRTTPMIRDWQFYTPTSTPGKSLPYSPDPTPEEAWWPTTTWAPLPTVPNPEAAFAIDLHQATTASLVPLVETGILSFSTQAATLAIDVFQHSQAYRDFKHGLWRIVHPQTQAWIGVMNLGPVNPGADTGTVTGTGTADGKITSLSMAEEFIALAMAEKPPHIVDGVNDGRDTFDTNLFRKLDVENNLKLLVCVMWIRWGADGTAKRMGIGQVHVDAWESVRPQMKRINLS